MPDALLVLFRVCVLALLYLFFFRVLRAVWTEVSTEPVSAGGAEPVARPRRERRSRASTKGERQLRVVEPEEMAGATFPLGDELTIGRAAGCQITLDDSYVSQLHARVFRRDGQIYAEDLGSTNGTYLNRGKVSGPMILSPGDRLQIGRIVMELT